MNNCEEKQSSLDKKERHEDMSTDKSQKDFLGNKRKNVSISNLKLKKSKVSKKKKELNTIKKKKTKFTPTYYVPPKVNKYFIFLSKHRTNSKVE